MNARVVSVARSHGHRFSKTPELYIDLVAGRGVAGDAHNGVTVRHRSRVAQDPTQPNLRQVHLLHQELFRELDAKGFRVAAGDLGENLTTADIDLLSLPRGTCLHFGPHAVVELTGLRNPCRQIDAFQPGLMAATLARGDNGRLLRKAGVMGIVLVGGTVSPGDAIGVTLPTGDHQPLAVV